MVSEPGCHFSHGLWEGVPILEFSFVVSVTAWTLPVLYLGFFIFLRLDRNVWMLFCSGTHHQSPNDWGLCLAALWDRGDPGKQSSCSCGSPAPGETEHQRLACPLPSSAPLDLLPANAILHLAGLPWPHHPPLLALPYEHTTLHHCQFPTLPAPSSRLLLPAFQHCPAALRNPRILCPGSLGLSCLSPSYFPLSMSLWESDSPPTYSLFL